MVVCSFRRPVDSSIGRDVRLELRTVIITGLDGRAGSYLVSCRLVLHGSSIRQLVLARRVRKHLALAVWRDDLVSCRSVSVVDRALWRFYRVCVELVSILECLWRLIAIGVALLIRLTRRRRESPASCRELVLVVCYWINVLRS